MRRPALAAALALVKALALALAATRAMATPPNIIERAEFSEPTGRYDHAILGDALEWGALKLTVDTCTGCDGGPHRRIFTIRLPQTRVFEDTAPRLVRLPDRASPVAMVVETDLSLGARLALYDEDGLLAATPFIGRTHRWLAPIGGADLDGDGQTELAYVDRPHLAKTIRVWRFIDDGKPLEPVAELSGFTNHRIGETEISGGLRDCGQGPEMIVADADWRDVYALTLKAGTLSAKKLGRFKGRESFSRAMACKTP